MLKRVISSLLIGTILLNGVCASTLSDLNPQRHTLNPSLASLSDVETDIKPRVTSSSNPSVLDLTNLLQEDKVASSRFTAHIADYEAPSRWKKTLHYGSALALGFALGNAMPPIFLEDMDVNGIPVNSFLWTAIWYTGVTFGVETVLRRLEDERKVALHALWTVGSLFQAMLHVYYLYEVEHNHHIDSGNKGWDEYYTFLACLAPFLFVNEFLDTRALGYDFFKTPRMKAIDRGVDALTSEELKDMHKKVFDYSHAEVSLPFLPEKKLSKGRQYTSLALAVVNLPTSYLVFDHVWKTLLGAFGAPEWTSYPFVLVSMGFNGYMASRALRKADLHSLYALPQGVYKSIPFIALGITSTKDLPLVLRVPSVVLLSIPLVIQESRELKETVVGVMKRIPGLKRKDVSKRRQLKDVLK